MVSKEVAQRLYEKNASDRENPIIKEMMDHMTFEEACKIYKHAHDFFLDEQEMLRRMF